MCVRTTCKATGGAKSYSRPTFGRQSLVSGLHTRSAALCYALLRSAALCCARGSFALSLVLFRLRLHPTPPVQDTRFHNSLMWSSRLPATRLFAYARMCAYLQPRRRRRPETSGRSPGRIRWLGGGIPHQISILMTFKDVVVEIQERVRLAPRVCCPAVAHPVIIVAPVSSSPHDHFKALNGLRIEYPVFGVPGERHDCFHDAPGLVKWAAAAVSVVVGSTDCRPDLDEQEVVSGR